MLLNGDEIKSISPCYCSGLATQKDERINYLLYSGVQSIIHSLIFSLFWIKETKGLWKLIFYVGSSSYMYMCPRGRERGRKRKKF